LNENAVFELPNVAEKPLALAMVIFVTAQQAQFQKNVDLSDVI
jgi:hypothetical protein